MLGSRGDALASGLLWSVSSDCCGGPTGHPARRVRLRPGCVGPLSGAEPRPLWALRPHRSPAVAPGSSGSGPGPGVHIAAAAQASE